MNVTDVLADGAMRSDFDDLARFGAHLDRRTVGDDAANDHARANRHAHTRTDGGQFRVA